MRLCGYCIMGNHWHLLLWPIGNGDLSEFMRWITLTHTQRFHISHGTVGIGHLYQRRFKSFPVQDNGHYLTVMRYIEANPLRAELVKRAGDWLWSSLAVRSYSEDRPKINILEEPEGNVSCEAYQKAVMTKSDSWSYEEEFRTIFPVDDLEIMQQQELAHLKDFNGKKTWFLRLNPISIREVIFGLYTDESLKSDIRKLIERQDIQHVKLYQAEESETYTLNLKECNFY